MSVYEIVQNSIRLVPLVLLIPTFAYLLRVKWYWRFIAVILIGWAVVAISTLTYWWYAIEFAPTEEIRRELALKDGAPRVVGVLFGWVFAAIYLGAMEFSRVVFKLLLKIIKNN